MRVLLINQFFPPDTQATGQLMSDLALYLTEMGEEVKVICGGSHATSDDRPVNSLTVARIGGARFNRGKLGRVISYASFLPKALWESLLGPRPDVVITLTTPPLLSWIGLILQKARNSRHVIWEMDMYPDVAVALGILRGGGWIDKATAWMADRARKRADRVIALGACMRDRLLAHGIPPQNIMVCHNWAQESGPTEYSARDDRLTVLYSGNLGLAHDASTVAGAAEKLPQIHFVFAGGGSRLPEITKGAGSAPNISYLEYCSRDELMGRLSRADLGLITQRDACLGMVVPSKTYGIMAAGKPLLFVGPRRAEPARIIERFSCGWQVDCGDVTGLVALLEMLDSNRELVKAAGHRAYLAYQRNYRKELGTARIAAIVTQSSAKDRETVAK